MQALRIADKDGWEVALAYLDDPLVDGPDEEKRFKKARRAVQLNKTAANFKKRQNDNPSSEYERRTKSKNYGVAEGEQGTSYQARGTSARKTWGQENTCWTCNRAGHFASSCPRRRNFTNTK